MDKAETIRLFVTSSDENMHIPTKVLCWLNEYAATLRQQAGRVDEGMVADALRVFHAAYAAARTGSPRRAGATYAAVQAVLQFAAGPVVDGWQPIETAPKDGKSVLLAFGGKKPVGGWWNDDRYAKVPRPYWSTDNERIVGITWLRSNPPIAWMPLPASPTPDKEGE